MLEEALPIAVGVGAALLPALAFGGVAAARAFIYLGAAEAGVLQALEEGKSEEEALKISESGAIASPLERASKVEASPRSLAAVPVPKIGGGACSYGFAARFIQ